MEASSSALPSSQFCQNNTEYKIVSIEAYLKELSEKHSNEQKHIEYDYRVFPANNIIIYTYNSDINTINTDTFLIKSKIVYEGTMKHYKDDIYYVDFPKNKIRVKINFFM